ncbi:MAG: class I SAM-dependent methyltransferase [Deltaproteobacteria bacterium]|nr:class I SAM-dependent methyltransferase [Deltaproteobacteria bacterium]
MEEIRSYSHRTTNQKIFRLLASGDLARQKIVDVGAGEGYFTGILGEYLKETYAIRPADVLRACDLYPEHFKYREVPCDRIDLAMNLPYEDNIFDSVCSIEVIEHIEDQFRLIRELYRIARPGGKVIVTTPNIMNVNSRIRFMHSGFGLLYNPLPLRTKDPVRLSGHIHPIGFYYLAYMFYRCGFREVRVHFDKRKRSGVLWALFLYGIILPAHWSFLWHMKQKNRSLFEENRPLLEQINRFDMLTSRSLIVEGVK